jgi:hypothetical protein
MAIREGKYIGYFQVLEGSGILFSDDLDKLAGTWCFCYKIFETEGLTMSDIETIFPDKPQLGVVLEWLEQNKKEVKSYGEILHRVNKE